MHSLGSRIVGYCPVYIQCSCGHANVYNIFQKQDPWVKVYDNVMTLSMYCQIASPRGSSYHILFSFYICACWNSDKYSRGFSADPWGSLSSVQLSSLESSSPQILATVAFSDFKLCLSNSVGPKGSVLGSSSLEAASRQESGVIVLVFLLLGSQSYTASFQCLQIIVSCIFFLVFQWFKVDKVNLVSYSFLAGSRNKSIYI